MGWKKEKTSCDICSFPSFCNINFKPCGKARSHRMPLSCLLLMRPPVTLPRQTAAQVRIWALREERWICTWGFPAADLYLGARLALAGGLIMAGWLGSEVLDCWSVRQAILQSVADTHILGIWWVSRLCGEGGSLPGGLCISLWLFSPWQDWRCLWLLFQAFANPFMPSTGRLCLASSRI